MDEREKNLPKWAQEHLRDIRHRHTLATEQMTRELATLRPKMELLTARIASMTELLECAARGGHMTSAQIMDIIRAYSLTLTPID